MRNPDAAPELATLAATEKLPITVVRMDVDSDESVRTGAAEVLSARARIDVLVNNAGIPGDGPVEEANLSEFRRVMGANFFGALRCTQAVLPGMRQQRSGHIINVSSVAGVWQCLRKLICGLEMGARSNERGAGAGGEAVRNRVALVEPGVIATPVFTKVKPREWSRHYPQTKRMTALFRSSLQNPTGPSVVANKIVDIVKSGDSTLRHSVGPDAKGFLAWRAAMTDEQWIAWGGEESDEEWARNMKRAFGMDIKLS
jgi:NAD(P)-dependent dehydrogenase (short-subunit alcohol dehydrogenase family)